MGRLGTPGGINVFSCHQYSPFDGGSVKLRPQRRADFGGGVATSQPSAKWSVPLTRANKHQTNN
jgi:hypothetical protein